ncbi:hypothetical protein SAMN05660691_04167 [Rheinheimera pacifica]|uniref:Uncharacterized protein n=1 Tax=Rheinheimera pacifica TaxID=173990 RepID=A0A1H6NFT1_9GAMM|nr:hypothetical protein [Rheinheimera pacifica]SEI14107.1 hypothetical protein SAMN05660691_04167 [Rheinheimera pacifica]
MIFNCDTEFLENKARLFKWLAYGVLIPFLLTLYIEPSVFVIKGTLTGLMVCLAICCVVVMTKRYYDDALLKHSGEQVIVNQGGIEFSNKSTGYSFKRDNDNIVSVTYTRMFGIPKIIMQFANNEFYKFIWFKDSNRLYSMLKNKESRVTRA